MQRNTIAIAGVAIVVVAVGTYIALFGSKGLSTTSPLARQGSAVVVPFTTVVDGVQSGVLERVNYQIVSQEELNNLWKLIKATSTPPTVDFNTEQVVAIFARPAPRADISIAKIEDSKVRMFSIAVTHQEGPCTASSKSQTAPYQIVKVPATTLPLAHMDIVATTSCSN